VGRRSGVDLSRPEDQLDVDAGAPQEVVANRASLKTRWMDRPAHRPQAGVSRPERGGRIQPTVLTTPGARGEHALGRREWQSKELGGGDGQQGST
jgi:hypothetical protein